MRATPSTRTRKRSAAHDTTLRVAQASDLYHRALDNNSNHNTTAGSLDRTMVLLQRALAQLSGLPLQQPSPRNCAVTTRPGPRLDEQEAVSPEAAFCLYNHFLVVVVVPDVDTTKTTTGPSNKMKQDHHINNVRILTTAILYNLGYCYHLQALLSSVSGSHSNDKRRLPSRDKCLQRAMECYKLVLRTSRRQANHKTMPSSSSSQQQQQYYSLLCFATINNLGHAHSCLFQPEAMAVCQRLLWTRNAEFASLVPASQYCLSSQRLMCAPMA